MRSPPIPGIKYAAGKRDTLFREALTAVLIHAPCWPDPSPFPGQNISASHADSNPSATPIHLAP